LTSGGRSASGRSSDCTPMLLRLLRLVLAVPGLVGESMNLTLMPDSLAPVRDRERPGVPNTSPSPGIVSFRPPCMKGPALPGLVADLHTATPGPREEGVGGRLPVAVRPAGDTGEEEERSRRGEEPSAMRPLLRRREEGDCDSMRLW
jgi:hypothetical protein